MKIRLEKREYESKLLSVGVSFLMLFLALLAVAIIFWAYGVNPAVAYGKIFRGAFGSLYGFSETIVKAIPLLLCGIGLTLAFKALIWNIGAEGQLLIGAVAATGIALNLTAPSYVILPLMFAAGFVAGAAWSLLPAILKAKLNVNEVITTLMLNYIALKLVEYLVYGPWRGPEEWGFPYTSKFPPEARLPRIPGTRIHYPTLIIGVIAVVATYILLNKTKIGYEIRVVGENIDAARYAGINYLKTVLLVMVVSGGLAGIAGVGEVAGIQHRLRMGISPGYGYTAIIVAWLGGLNPWVTLASSILLGGLLVGGDIIQTSLGLPVAAIDIFNGIILIFIIAGEILKRYKIRIVR